MAWGQKVSSARKRDDPYTVLRARIAIRKALGHEPDEDQVEKEVHRLSKRGQQHTENNLSSADAIAAFERGEEVSKNVLPSLNLAESVLYMF